MSVPLPQGRTGTLLLMSATRELTQGDLLLLATQPKGARSTPAPSIQVLRATHHQAARLIARGLSYQQVAREVGRTAQRISDLMRDPTFRELVSYYETQLEELTTEDSVEFSGIVKDIARLSAEEIQVRLDDPVQRSQIPIGELRQLMGDALSRTVLPQKTAQPIQTAPVEITFNMGNRDLRYHNPNDADIIEAEADEMPAPSQSKDDADDLQEPHPLPKPRGES
jgi:transcriptional regulator with XRE-family HTH domain